MNDALRHFIIDQRALWLILQAYPPATGTPERATWEQARAYYLLLKEVR